MPHRDFLELVQAIEAVRRCEGRECMVVPEETLSQAAEVDALEVAKIGLCECPEGMSGQCPCCLNCIDKRNALRETLRSQGVVFPVGMLDG